MDGNSRVYQRPMGWQEFFTYITVNAEYSGNNHTEGTVTRTNITPNAAGRLGTASRSLLYTTNILHQFQNPPSGAIAPIESITFTSPEPLNETNSLNYMNRGRLLNGNVSHQLIGPNGRVGAARRAANIPVAVQNYQDRQDP